MLFTDFFSDLMGTFAGLVSSGFLLWMAFVVILFLKELFTPGDIKLKDYFLRVWRLFLLAFELIAYCGLLYALYQLFFGKNEGEVLFYTLMLVWALLGSVLFVRIRLRRRRLALSMQGEDGQE